MSISMYQASVPGVLRAMTALSVILDKAKTMAAARKIEDAALLAARLYPDMLPFSAQIQICSDTAKAMGARLAGIEPPKMPDEEKTLDELKARLAKTIDFLKSIDQAKFEGAENRKVEIPVRSGKLEFKGSDYLFMNALPNFYFHVTTAYDILRHLGFEIGKRDYLAAG